MIQTSSQIIVTPEVEEIQPAEQEEKAPVAVADAGSCSDFPPAVINAMIGITATLVLVIVGMGAYYVSAKKQQQNKRTAEGAKDFDSIAENPVPVENQQ